MALSRTELPCQRLSSITTRIKTNLSLLPFFRKVVRDYLPLQQGLRLFIGAANRKPIVSQRLSSTTTRIKTINCCCYLKANKSQRLSSTTTRIKTRGQPPRGWKLFWVRDYLPLQQGLRLQRQAVAAIHLNVRDYLPLQQGLRLHDNLFHPRT